MNAIFFMFFFPLCSSFLLFFFKDIFSKKNINFLVICNIILSFFSFLKVFYNFFNGCFFLFRVPLWNWIFLKNVDMVFCFLFDRISVIMLSMVLLIFIIVSLFSIWYMKKEKDSEYRKYFSYLNFFLISMYLLILSDNLIMMFLGWELLAFFSYLLIGFYYKNNHSGYFAMKSFFITRIFDIFFILAIFICMKYFHSVHFYTLYNVSKLYIIKNYNFYINILSIFFLLSAFAKSAQFPFHTWLLNAMIGPTPVSALMHSATMITSGVYLIIRMYPVLHNSQIFIFLLCFFSSFSILISSFLAIQEKNSKKILAYSTISQIGYMFLSIGLKYPYIAFLHLICHSFFKSLLFLALGSILKYFFYEQNIFKISIPFYVLPFSYFSSIMGFFSLLSVPVITSCFYSKGKILSAIYNSGNFCLILISFVSIFFTSLYVFRMYYLLFHNYNIKKNFYIDKNYNNFFYYFPLFFLSLGCTPIVWKVIYFFLKPFILSNFCQEHFYYLEIFIFLLTLSGCFFIYIHFNLLNFIKNFHSIYFFQKKYFLKLFSVDNFYLKFFVNQYINFTNFLKKNIFNNFIFLLHSQIKSVYCFFLQVEHFTILKFFDFFIFSYFIFLVVTYYKYLLD